MTGQNLLQLQQAKQLGAPLSQRSIHNLLREQSMTTMTFEEEMEYVDDDKANMPEPTGGGMRGVQSSLTGAPPSADPAPKPKMGED